MPLLGLLLPTTKGGNSKAYLLTTLPRYPIGAPMDKPFTAVHTLLSAPLRQLLTGSLSHRLLREYLSLCAESDRRDVIEALREAVVQMLHTRDGARVGLMCLWWGTTKVGTAAA